MTEHPENSQLKSSLESLIRTKYESNTDFKYFFYDYTKALDYCRDSSHIRFIPIPYYQEEVLKAHVALIIDDRLPKGEAFFGFLETPNDATVFGALWQSLHGECKKQNVQTLLGPVNGSVWHQYRCLKETDSSPFFKSELMCEPYYYSLLQSKNPTKEILYHSGHRYNTSAIIEAGKLSYEQFESTHKDFSIKETKKLTQEEAYSLVSISKKVFSDNWGYTELSNDEFLALYSSKKIDENLNSVYLLFHGDTMIGYLSTFNEDAVTLIYKTICILPEYQGKGLGNVLAYRAHRDALEKGVQKHVYALVRVTNNIQNFTKEDSVIFRKYATFEFEIQ